MDTVHIFNSLIMFILASLVSKIFPFRRSFFFFLISFISFCLIKFASAIYIYIYFDSLFLRNRQIFIFFFVYRLTPFRYHCWKSRYIMKKKKFTIFYQNILKLYTVANPMTFSCDFINLYCLLGMCG